MKTDAIERCIGRAQEEGWDEEAQEARSELKAIKEGGWVSVEDRLPEDSTTVLALNVDKGSHYLIIYRPEGWVGTDKEWYLKEFGPIKGITHWMPLPAPPSPEQTSVCEMKANGLTGNGYSPEKQECPDYGSEDCELKDSKEAWCAKASFEGCKGIKPEGGE